MANRKSHREARSRSRCALLTAVLLLVAVPSSAQRLVDDGWLVVESRHFTLYTNATPERGYEIAESLERFRAVFAQLSPQIELKSPAPTKLLAFKDAESYAPYKTVADRAGSRILGQFLSHVDGNYLTLDAGTELVDSFTVIYHEYVHYFVRHNFPGVPLWFNEGLAEYYSTFAIEDGLARVGAPVDRHLDWLRRHSELGLDEVLATDQGSRKHQAGGAGRFYAVSWILVHYLLSGEAERLDQTADFFLRLSDGEDPEEAFEEAFDLRLRTLEDDLVEYSRGADLPQAEIPLHRLPTPKVDVFLLPPQEAFFHLGDLLVHMGRAEAAEHHFQLALDHQGDHAEAHAGLAHVRERQNRFEEAGLLYDDAVELGSVDPLTYLLHGRYLLRRLSATALSDRPKVLADARRQLRQVVELDPGYGAGWADFARSYLPGASATDKEDARAGLQALARARELLPDDLSLVFLQVRLELKSNRPDAAEELVEGILAQRAPADRVAEAREQVARHRLLQASERAFADGDPESGIAYYDEAVSITSDAGLKERMETRLLALQERYQL